MQGVQVQVEVIIEEERFRLRRTKSCNAVSNVMDSVSSGLFNRAVGKNDLGFGPAFFVRFWRVEFLVDMGKDLREPVTGMRTGWDEMGWDDGGDIGEAAC